MFAKHFQLCYSRIEKDRARPFFRTHCALRSPLKIVWRLPLRNYVFPNLQESSTLALRFNPPAAALHQRVSPSPLSLLSRAAEKKLISFCFTVTCRRRSPRCCCCWCQMGKLGCGGKGPIKEALGEGLELLRPLCVCVWTANVNFWFDLPRDKVRCWASLIK